MSARQWKRRPELRPTPPPPKPSPIRGDDDYPLEHWLAVKRCAFPPGVPPEEQLRHHRWVEERIAAARLRQLAREQRRIA